MIEDKNIGNNRNDINCFYLNEIFLIFVNIVKNKKNYIFFKFL
jgi:hypothetical protein